MQLGLALLASVPVLKTPPRGIEGVANGDICVFVSMIGGRIAVDHDIAAAWQGDLKPHIEQIAVSSTMAPAFHCNAASQNAGMEFFQLLSFLVDPPAQRIARQKIVLEGDFQRYSHHPPRKSRHQPARIWVSHCGRTALMHINERDWLACSR
jgi:hypothetical protein